MQPIQALNSSSQTPITFSWYATQVALVDGLTFGLALAFPVAFVVLCFATSNLVLAFYAMVTIGLIVASVLGTVYLIGWNLGIKESVAGVVVIGFSVDYTIHLGHMFDVARSQGLTTRQEKFAYSIRKMGETVLAGAITTAGSTVFLLACQLTFFTAMGTLIILTVAYSPVWKSTSVSGAAVRNRHRHAIEQVSRRWRRAERTPRRTSPRPARRPDQRPL